MLPESNTVTTSVKAATALNHLKNNRIEYLLVLILSHFMGITDLVIARASGVCF